MAWEHRYCGTIVDDENCPDLCDFCATLLVRVTRGRAAGWRRVGDAERKQQKARRGRRRISQKRRQAIYARDGFRCVKCGCKDLREMTLDHRVPLAKGGSDGDDNLQTMCRDCNRRKADS